MVFGFFSRKPAPPAESTEIVEAGPSNPAPLTPSGPIVSPDFQFPAKQQLHTPSPSIDSAIAITVPKADVQPLPKPKKPRAKPKPKPKPKPQPVAREISPVISEIPPGPADTPSPPPDDVLVTDPSALHSLIASVPAQTLHAYTLAHLNPVPPSPFSPLPSGIAAPGPIVAPTPQLLTALTTFFASLAPPPKLHCVRCHRGYFELENNDTACRVPHDDESAIVERIGLGQGAGTQYETLWGCCGRTVDGDGDMGPPDGWCYEGGHTTDMRRARFRADSTPQDDKLASCTQLRCHMPPRNSLSRASRKRNRRAMEVDEDEDDDEQSVVSSSHTHARTHSRSISTSSAKAKGKMKAPEEEEDEETKARPAKRVRARKISTTAAKKDEEREEEEKECAMEDAMDVDDASPPSPPKSPKRARKSATTKTQPASTINDADKSKPSPPSPKSRARSVKPRSSMGSAPVQRSPLSASYVPASASSVVHVRPESPTRKPHGRVEVEIMSRSPPKSGLLAKASVGSLRAKTSTASLRGSTRTKAKMLGEVVDTSIDGEGWS